MNDQQIESLLEKVRENSRCETDVIAEDAIWTRFRCAVRRRRRIAYAACAALFIVFAASCYKHYYHSGPTINDVLDRLEVAQALFPEAGVCLVNWEISTYEKQSDEPGTQWLKLTLERMNGKEPLRIDLIVAQEDYIVLTDGPVTGELLVSRCGKDEFGETIVDFNLFYCRPDGSRLHIKNSVILFPFGVSSSVGSFPQDYVLGLYLDSIRKG